eukprot:TRINITY_DN9335_c0_g1_i1.p1 TRINITY_DN9335_c0_g1~~TRINITY_DN9335_c0_g1_i1.p1  ORF type:complete len:123 (+),score=22.81 TRINITY_DN9335_c0_g1_i1:263-631(+)
MTVCHLSSTWSPMPTPCSDSIPVNAVLLKMNYATDSFSASDYPVMTVLDSYDNAVTCYDIDLLAPIRTPNGTNLYMWRGVTATDKIAQLKLTGSTLTYWDITFFTAPPTTPTIQGSDGPVGL